MSSTLSYGYKLPATGDRGNVWFPNLEDNITRVNSHDHDGTDSAQIPTSNLTKGSATISSGSWSSQGGGTYRQEITLPAGYSYASTLMRFILTGGASDDEVHPVVEEGTASNKYYVYTNDNTVSYAVTYV